MDVPDETATVLAGRYEVGPLVGIGGTAQVHRAWDRERSCPVAVKIFRPGATPTPGYGGARELEVLTGVRHRGLVGVHGAGVDPQGCPFVVMDLVDGRSLSARLHDGPLSAGAVTRLGTVLADALAVVHRRGVVHRDVKPSNVLLDTDDYPWLTDFGIARIVDATRITATGIVVGTAAYMAPEQVRGEEVGPAADVYALGLLLLEAVTGRREYEGGAVESALARLHRAPLVPAAVPEPLAATVRAMTAPAPGDRPTAEQVAAALKSPGRPAGPGTGARRAAAARRIVPVAALASLVAAAFAGAAAVLGAGASHDGGAPVAVRSDAPASALVAPQGTPHGAPLVPDLGGAVDAAVAAARPVPVALTSRASAPAAPRPPKPASAGARAVGGGAGHAEDADGHAARHDEAKGDRDGDKDGKNADARNDADKNAGEKNDKGDQNDDRNSGKGGDDNGGKSGSGKGSSGKGSGGGHDDGGHSGSNSGKG